MDAFTLEARRSSLGRLLTLLWALGLGAIFIGIFCGPIYIGPVPNFGARWSYEARQIGLMMYSYANDHGQRYPDGKSSTEVFQELLDGGYATDPNMFYIPLPGKAPPVPGQKLKPENVCWDVTSGVDLSSPDTIPIAFMTGYRVSYAPGASAVTLIKPYPRYNIVSWADRWRYRALQSDEYTPPLGIAVVYKNNHARFLALNLDANPDGAIPNFVPSELISDGKPHHQLTPDGVLP